jgi:hypothetical protein
MDRLLYLLLCIGAPLVWGLAVAALSRWVDARVPRPQPAERRLPDIDYYI